MAIEITMPQLSDTMDEGTILSWLKAEGEAVYRGDALAEVATDKADLEIESFHEGVLLKIHSPQGTTVKVGAVIALIGEAGESVSTPAQADAVAKPPAVNAGSPQPAVVTASPSPAASNTSSNNQLGQVHQSTPAAVSDSAIQETRVKISPLAKNLAGAYGVDYHSIGGSGDGGRIVKKDIERAAGREVSASDVAAAIASSGSGATVISQQVTPAPQQQPPAAQLPNQPAVAATGSPVVQAPALNSAPVLSPSAVPLSRMRATIASQMVTSVTTIPHFYVVGKILADALEKTRASLKPLPQYEGITVNHLIIKAVALALRAVPRINASYQNGGLLQPQEVNVGIITAVTDGLLIPVVKAADRLPLIDIVGEARSLVQRARSGRPKSEDLLGGTFCISNIGKYDVENFTAIINPSQGAILAVSSIQDEPVVEDGRVVSGKVLRVTLSVDHRIIDGVMAGEFVTELKRLLEDPVLLLA